MSRMESKSVWTPTGVRNHENGAFPDRSHLSHPPLTQSKIAEESALRRKPGLY